MPGPTVAVTRHGASSGALQLGPLPILQNRRSTNNSQHYQQPRPPPLVAAVLAVDVSDWSCEREVPAVEAPRRCFSTYRSEEHTSELQSLMRISYAVFCLKKKKS